MGGKIEIAMEGKTGSARIVEMAIAKVAPTGRNLFVVILLGMAIQLPLHARVSKHKLPRLQQINYSKVGYITISDKAEASDTIDSNIRKLTVQQAGMFVAAVNQAKSKGPYKCMLRYSIHVYFTDGSKRTFYCCSNVIKEENDWGFAIGDKEYFDALWKGTQEDPVATIRNIFEQYIEYNESTDSYINKTYMLTCLQQIRKIQSPEDFELLINVWMYYDPTDFAGLHLIPELLKQQRSQSIEALKKRIQHKKEWERIGTAPYSDLSSLLAELQAPIDLIGKWRLCRISHTHKTSRIDGNKTEDVEEETVEYFNICAGVFFMHEDSSYVLTAEKYTEAFHWKQNGTELLVFASNSKVFPNNVYEIVCSTETELKLRTKKSNVIYYLTKP